MKLNFTLVLVLLISACNNNEEDKLQKQLKEQEREIQDLKRQIESQNDKKGSDQKRITPATNIQEKSNLFSAITKYVYAEINMEMSVPHISNGEVSYTTETNTYLTNIIKVEDINNDKENKIKDEARQSVRLVRGMGRIDSIKISIKKFNSYSKASESRDTYNYTGPDVFISTPN